MGGEQKLHDHTFATHRPRPAPRPSPGPGPPLWRRARGAARGKGRPPPGSGPTPHSPSGSATRHLGSLGARLEAQSPTAKVGASTYFPVRRGPEKWLTGFRSFPRSPAPPAPRRDWVPLSDRAAAVELPVREVPALVRRLRPGYVRGRLPPPELQGRRTHPRAARSLRSRAPAERFLGRLGPGRTRPTPLAHHPCSHSPALASNGRFLSTSLSFPRLLFPILDA